MLCHALCLNFIYTLVVMCMRIIEKKSICVSEVW